MWFRSHCAARPPPARLANFPGSPLAKMVCIFLLTGKEAYWRFAREQPISWSAAPSSMEGFQGAKYGVVFGLRAETGKADIQSTFPIV